MGAGGIPSGGVIKVYSEHQGLPSKTEHINSRYDLYVDGRRKQSRWFNHNGIVVRNRDYFHTDNKGDHTFPHDHDWKIANGEPIRISTNSEPDYEHYNSDEESE